MNWLVLKENCIAGIRGKSSLWKSVIQIALEKGIAFGYLVQVST